MYSIYDMYLLEGLVAQSAALCNTARYLANLSWIFTCERSLERPCWLKGFLLPGSAECVLTGGRRSRCNGKLTVKIPEDFSQLTLVCTGVRIIRGTAYQN